MDNVLFLPLPLLYDAQEREKYDFALEVAKAQHGDQMRTYPPAPYWSHLVRVAVMVSKVPGRTIQMIQAALLHDVLEDTPYLPETLFYQFGEEVGRLVVWLTDVKKEEGNRAKRHVMNTTRLGLAPPEAKTIKLADMIDNTATIVQYSKSFAIVYLQEKADALNALRGGDHDLWMSASKNIIAAQNQLFPVPHAQS